ncbi:MAG: hypothetical protein ABJE95_15600 [Byssovorax sp.]
MRRFSVATTFSTGGLLLAAAFLAACDGGVGDQPSAPLANELGSCGRLAKTIGPATWLDPKQTLSKSCPLIPPDRTVCLSGLSIVAIDKYDETGDGKSSGNFYVEDTSADPPPYAGVTIFRPSFSPPDLRLAEGDVVDFLGTYQEFNGPSTFMFPYCRTFPELSGALTFRFDSNLPLVAKVIPLADLKSYETGRPYLGTLVKLINPQLDASGATSSGGRYASGLEVGSIANVADVPHVTNELFDMKNLGPPMPAGAVFKSITGVVTYFGGFHLAPRSAADFEL